MAALSQLKASQPSAAKKSRQELCHVALVESLEERVERIDAELAVRFIMAFFWPNY
jgi:hypothetical protein